MVINGLELILEASGLGVYISCFTTNIAFPLSGLITFLFESSDARRESTFDALPVFGSESILSLQSFSLAEKFSLRITCGR